MADTSSAVFDGRFQDASEWLERTNSLLNELEAQAARLRTIHEQFLVFIANKWFPSIGEIIFMFRKRVSSDKEEAKKLFFTYRKKGTAENQPEGTPSNEPSSKEPETTEEKIAMIMDYMKETSSKLDHIENDISYLKQQVEEIKKRI